MKVRLISKTQPLIPDMTLEEYIVYVARVSNDTQEQRERKEGVEGLLRYMLENKHESPFDFVDFAFEVETSRDIGRQYLRHRTCAFQEHSQRYSDKVEFEEIEIRKQGDSNRQGGEEVFDPQMFYDGIDKVTASNYVNDIMLETQTIYKEMINVGVAKEVARGILPGCTRTSMVIKNNVRNWLNILNIRLDNHAQKEARKVANLIYKELKKEIPFIIKVWEERFTYYKLSRLVDNSYHTFEEYLGVVKTKKEALQLMKTYPEDLYPIIIKSIGIGGPDVVNFKEVYNAS